MEKNVVSINVQFLEGDDKELVNFTIQRDNLQEAINKLGALRVATELFNKLEEKYDPDPLRVVFGGRSD